MTLPVVLLYILPPRTRLDVGGPREGMCPWAGWLSLASADSPRADPLQGWDRESCERVSFRWGGALGSTDGARCHRTAPVP